MPRALCAGTLVLVLLSACTSDPEVEAEGQRGEPAASVLPAPRQSPASTTATAVATPFPRISEVAENYWFRTPTGNIGCGITPEGVLCELREAAWAPEQPPAPCDNADWSGRAVSVGAEGTTVGVCATDTVWSADSPLLAYDTGVSSGDLRCISRRDGLTCEHVVSTKGFTVTKAKLTLF